MYPDKTILSCKIKFTGFLAWRSSPCRTAQAVLQQSRRAIVEVPLLTAVRTSHPALPEPAWETGQVLVRGRSCLALRCKGGCPRWVAGDSIEGGGCYIWPLVTGLEPGRGPVLVISFQFCHWFPGDLGWIIFPFPLCRETFLLKSWDLQDEGSLIFVHSVNVWVKTNFSKGL